MDQQERSDFSKKVQIAATILIASTLLIWLFLSAFKVFLLVFAGMMVSIFFRSIGRAITEKTGMSFKITLPIAIVGVLGIWTGVYFLLAPKVSTQVKRLEKQIPAAYEDVKSSLSESQTGRLILNQIPDDLNLSQSDSSDSSSEKRAEKSIRSAVKKFFSSTLGVLGDLYVIFLLSLFFTAQPAPYTKGLIKLFPQKRRKRMKEVIDASSITLRLWLFGKLLSMLVVAILSFIGLYLMGVPLYITLALFAGLVSFIPNFGPIIAIVPAFLVGYIQSPALGFWVIALYVVIQAIESNIITPIIMRKQIEVPLAMTLFSQILLALLVGGLGLIFATPIVALVLVLVQMLYIEDVLGDKSIDVKGERLLKEDD